jgi:hypothetical protein
MKKLHLWLIWSVALIVVRSCDPSAVEANFEDMIDITIYDYIVDNETEFSSFLSIIEQGGIDKTLSAYNPNGLGYSLFLPTNDAVDQFIEDSEQFSSLEDLLSDSEYVSIFSRFHALNQSIKSDDFPFGALPEYTLSGDILTVGFVVEPDTSYYNINNQAPVATPNIETSNGYVHVISSALVPVTLTTFEWLVEHEGYSLFLSAVEATGYKDLLDVDTKDENTDTRPFTLFLEHDSIFNLRGIHSFEDLASDVSPEDDDYTNVLNPLNNFIAYHLLTDIKFLDDFEEISTNYSTYSDIPLRIDGLGLDIAINKGKQVFDTLVSGVDTTIVDFIGFNYDESNVLTQSGTIHFIDQILRQVQPSRAIQTFQFGGEPLFDEFRNEPGEYLVEDTSALLNINWSGSDLFFVQEGDEDHPAWGGDYLVLGGDFTIRYTIPKLVQGSYMVLFGAEAFSSQNALVEVSIDGKKLGGLIDLTKEGSADYPFAQIELGTVNFVKYEQHTIQVRSFVPGNLLWDYIRFEPN